MCLKPNSQPFEKPIQVVRVGWKVAVKKIHIGTKEVTYTPVYYDDSTDKYTKRWKIADGWKREKWNSSLLCRSDFYNYGWHAFVHKKDAEAFLELLNKHFFAGITSYHLIKVQLRGILATGECVMTNPGNFFAPSISATTQRLIQVYE